MMPPPVCSGFRIAIVRLGNGRRTQAQVRRWPTWCADMRGVVIVPGGALHHGLVIVELNRAGRVSICLCSELPFEPEQLRKRHTRSDNVLIGFVHPRLNLPLRVRRLSSTNL